MFNEVVFKRQRLALVVHHDGLEIGDFADQRAGLRVGPARFQKIRSHAVPQGPRLSDIQNRPAGVFEQIDSGTFRQARGFFT